MCAIDSKHSVFQNYPEYDHKNAYITEYLKKLIFLASLIKVCLKKDYINDTVQSIARTILEE